MSAKRQDLLSRSALGVFRLNGQFLAVAEELARPAGLTAAWWQVLGAVLREPLSVSGIAREMDGGLGVSPRKHRTRQSVQRIADLLVERGLAEYRPNPAHRRAKLLAPTEEGFAAVRRIDPGHAVFADRLAEAFGERELADAVRLLERLSKVLEQVGPPVTEP
ncbi:MarR family winged helix-turn-helix transcriptional regulator [Streptomyces sp. NPDC051963]|uniref:MarR family winged helix-turn-helix transcriptional regulator n=1 Tax=Streptomyces sp. NPDC051963 TaxID=3365678 RepID=UPI0037D55233